MDDFHFSHPLERQLRLSSLSRLLVALFVIYALIPLEAGAQVATSTRHSCAILDDGTVKCWGWNSQGGLGLGDTNSRGDETGEMGANLLAVDVGSEGRATSIAVGYGHTCVTFNNHAAKCWGLNEGLLGIGDTDSRGDEPGEMGANLPFLDLGTDRTVTQISTRAFHTCALLDDGTVKCWGTNEFGQLGLGDTNGRGDEPGEMGNNLPAVDLGSEQTAKQIAVGSFHTCALLNDGSIKCWGGNRNEEGALGLGDINSRGDEPNEMGDNLPGVDLGSGRTAQQVVAGGLHTCALLDNGRVKCWGWNGEGELGIGDTDNRGDGPNEMGDSLPAVELGSETVTHLAAGDFHTCVIFDNGGMKCWGSNNVGALGLGDTDHRGDRPNEMGDDLPTVDLGSGRIAKQMGMGDARTCVALDNGTLKCWGWNTEGALGLGDTVDRGGEPGDMGENLPFVDLDGRVQVGVADQITIPIDFQLSAAYPNPSNAQVRFTLTLAETQYVKVEVVDMLSRQVATLHEGILPLDQEHVLVFDGTGLSSGVYLCHIRTESFSAVRQLVLVK